MKSLFIPEKSVFSDAFDVRSKFNGVSAAFLNTLAIEKAKRGYSVAIIPYSLVDLFLTSGFFKESRTFELVKAFIDVEESVFSENLDADYFEVARVRAVDKEPRIVTNRTDLDTFRGQHGTHVITTERALKLIDEGLEL